MENPIEKLWYLTLDWSMIWVCIGAVAVLILALETNRGLDIETEKAKEGVTNYLVPTWKNYLYHIFAGLLMLTFVSEIGVPLFDLLIEKFGWGSFSIESSEEISHTLAVISGLGGGFILAKIIRLFQKLN